MGNITNFLCGTQYDLHLKLLIGSPERLYGGPADLEHLWPFRLSTGLQGDTQWLQQTCSNQAQPVELFVVVSLGGL